MLTTVLILALCGVAGGYLFGKSALFAYQRDKWERKRDVLDVALYGMFDQLLVPLHVVDGDHKILGLEPNEIPLDVPEGWAFEKMRARWAFWFLVSCNICSGWHVIYLAMACSAVVAWLTDFPTTLAWAEAFPVWLAACGLHTAITGIGNRTGIWE